MRNFLAGVIPKAPRDDPEITALSQRQLIVSPHHICPRSSRNVPARSPRPACRGSGGLRTSNHRSWKGQPAIAAMWPVMPSRRAYRSRRKMMHPAQRSLARKALPAVAVAVAVLVTRLLGPSGDIPFTLFLAAVFLSAWYGGLGPALTAVVLSLLAVYSFFVPPHSDLDMGRNLASRSVRFVLVSGLLIWLTESRRRAEEGAARERGAVPRHVRERRRRHRPPRSRGPLPARQPEVLRDRRLRPRGVAREDLDGHDLSG